MPNSYNYSNTAQQTTLTGSVSSGATTIQVVATTGFPTSYPYILAVDFGATAEELVSVTSAASTTLTVTRGFGGTSAQSHSLGAVVRHVYNAQDATDFRTHEAATAAVHGVAGTLVGTSDVQTLAGKTLTAPTINAGALSGTFTGSPTLSGNVTFSGTLTGAGALAGTFSGTPTFTGSATWSGASLLVERALVTDNAYRARIAGDTNSRMLINADGKMIWGSGSAVGDTNLYRSAADTLTTDDALAVTGELRPGNLVRSTRALATDSAYETRVSGDANARWFTKASGETWWGDGTAVQDTNLYRSAANTLKTDDDFVIKTHKAHYGESGVTSVSFTSQTSFTVNVSFTTAFSAAPRVYTNINSGAAATASWGSRAITITTTGFTLFVFGPSATWSAIDVSWTAEAA